MRFLLCTALLLSAQGADAPLRFEATAYYTRFDGFIFRRLTGQVCGETPDTCTGPPFNAPLTDQELKQAVTHHVARLEFHDSQEG